MEEDVARNSSLKFQHLTFIPLAIAWGILFLHLL
jgi:hypothetical protein